MIARLTQLFPLWAVLVSVVAYFAPGPFAASKPAIVPLLGVIMFGMGMTLRGKDFAEVAKHPQRIGLGVALQYLVMPFAAWLIGKALGLSEGLLAGLVLVGCCPGGTASNVIAYLAKADVALSIALTTVSTILSFLLTPWLVWLLLGTTIDVDVLGMMWSIVKVILLPVTAGVCLNTYAGEKLTKAKDLFPLVSVAAITYVIGIVVGLNAGRLATTGAIAVLAVVLHNSAGLLGGYWLARLFRQPKRIARTLAIEVGMQNSGLGVVLAIKHFTALAALPGAIFSVWHNLSGSVLAMVWSRQADDHQRPES